MDYAIEQRAATGAQRRRARLMLGSLGREHNGQPAGEQKSSGKQGRLAKRPTHPSREFSQGRFANRPYHGRGVFHPD